jgi:membrane protein required for colicin V production
VTSFDWILISILVSSTVAGLMAGFARVTIGLAAGIFGILFGFWFYRMPAAWFSEYFESKTASSVLGFALVFVSVLVFGGLLGRLIAKIFKWAGLTWLDRLMGGAFGAVRGMIVVAGIVTIVTAFAPNPPPRWIAQSEMMPYAAGFAKVLAAVAPRELKERFDENMERIHKLWSGKSKPDAAASAGSSEPKLKKESY